MPNSHRPTRQNCFVGSGRTVWIESAKSPDCRWQKTGKLDMFSRVCSVAAGQADRPLDLAARPSRHGNTVTQIPILSPISRRMTSRHAKCKQAIHGWGPRWNLGGRTASNSEKKVRRDMVFANLAHMYMFEYHISAVSSDSCTHTNLWMLFYLHLCTALLLRHACLLFYYKNMKNLDRKQRRGCFDYMISVFRRIRKREQKRRSWWVIRRKTDQTVSDLCRLSPI